MSWTTSLKNSLTLINPVHIHVHNKTGFKITKSNSQHADIKAKNELVDFLVVSLFFLELFI